MIKRRIPDDWLLPLDWLEQVFEAVGKRFPVEVRNNKIVIIDNSELDASDVQTIKDTVLNIREVINDITQ